MPKLDNRHRDKAVELEEIEEDETPIDEDKASKDLKAEQQQTPDDLEEDETQEEIVEEELDAAEEEVKPKAEEKEPAKPELEERYRESTREAQILTERNRQLTDAFVKIDEVKDPDEQELQKAARIDGLDWEELTVAEKLLVKKTYIADQKLKVVQDAVKDVQNIDAWADKVDAYLDEIEQKQTHKALSGKEQQFRAFAMKSTHRGTPVEFLLSHFLMTSEPSARKRGSMLLTPSVGAEPPKKKTEIDDADSSANLRNTNQREWQRQLKAGKIKIEV